MLNELLLVLKFIYEQKVIYRDLKLENIICCSFILEIIGWMININKLVLVDFGAVKVIIGIFLMQLGIIIGSLEYVVLE